MAIEHNIQQARKASFAVFSRAKELNLSPSCEIHLLNTVVKPILLYGCELYCFENICEIEKFYLNCLKRILHVNKITLTNAVYGETGFTPLYVDILIRSLSFYLKVKNGLQSSLACTMVNYLHIIYNYKPTASLYLKYIKRSLDNLGFSYFFHNVILHNETIFEQIKRIKMAANDQFIQRWSSEIKATNKALFYRSFKNEVKFEPYLDILPARLRIRLTRFRISNHRLPIETGRWRMKLRRDRVCPHCNNKSIGDEFHNLFECKHFNTARRKLIETKFYTNPSVYKSMVLVNSTKKHTLVNLAKLIDTIMKSYE